MKLRPYQEQAIEFWLKHKRVYFAIDMGLGKTAIALHTINQLGLRTLVVAPLKVTYNTWPEEIRDWGMDSDVSIEVLHGSHKLEKFKSPAQVHAINYEGLPWLYNQLYELHKAKKPLPYKALVLDESTFIKDPKSNRFEYLKALNGMFEYAACLSGTPAPNSLMDLWSQYYILNEGESLEDNYFRFRERYFEQDAYSKYNWNLRFGAENAIHKAIAPITFRLSSDDHIKLPDRLFNKINLELSTKERKMYKSFKKDFVLVLEDTDITSLNSASLSTKLRQFVQGAIYENFDDGTRQVHHLHDKKVRALKQLLEDIPGRNVLCLVQFKFEIEMLLKSFPETPYITGSTSNKEGNKYLEQWNRGELPLLIAHPRSVGRGLNMQKGGRDIVWYALPWSLDDYLQTNKRLHRPGQKATVIINHLIMKGTIDEHVFEALNDKEMTQGKLLEFLRQKTKELGDE